MIQVLAPRIALSGAGVGIAVLDALHKRSALLPAGDLGHIHANAAIEATRPVAGTGIRIAALESRNEDAARVIALEFRHEQTPVRTFLEAAATYLTGLREAG
jgi:hypothetical protein